MDRFLTIDGFSTNADQGELLRTILVSGRCPRDRPLRIAEIGVYKGRGTCLWNDILLSQGYKYEYHAIDHFNGSSEHEKEIDYYAITMENLRDVLHDVQKCGNILQILQNDSLSQAHSYPDDYFDIVYIDASHEYEYVIKDIHAWLPKVRPSGILCGDDYIEGWPGVVRAVNEVLGNDNIKVVGQQQWMYHKS